MLVHIQMCKIKYTTEQWKNQPSTWDTILPLVVANSGAIVRELEAITRESAGSARELKALEHFILFTIIEDLLHYFFSFLSAFTQ
ncbi:hypothetical protein A374_18634 [Fictibacillus macauensis ZFHKF-1]|uniref:Uncharacterized protein n=1 Tax=Fictibacillus macauensis ZFHKF-1 TaxID=1196324 RepID=I8UA19_9BACL|nr:hypothetical protein A374_18634 [Fictibacillus macauensis ZFHKF-1]